MLEKKFSDSRNEMKTRIIKHTPLEYDYTHSAEYRWLNKSVKETRLLDDMEDEALWQHLGPGKMSFTGERVFEKGKALKLESSTKIDNHADPGDFKNYGRPFGESVCKRLFRGEDWTLFNRISFRVYPVLPGFRVISMYAMLHNDGDVKIPDDYEREGLNFFLLKPGEWNHVVWEIASLPRDKVTALDIIYRLQGNEPGATDTVCFYIDRLELEKVEADHCEGWNVAPGSISYSHTGYHTGTVKSAISAGDIKESEFQVINVETGKTVLNKLITDLRKHIGEFRLMDFSEIREAGTYKLRAGSHETEPFRIDSDIWLDSIWKTINFFFCERCGFEVPGIHGNCHRDWQCIHEDKSIIINGGWHDAGDLSQGVCNTGESVYAMYLLAEKFKTTDHELYERLLEEAGWGLDWLLKTRFGDGYRSVWATMDFWTDGILGNFDDIKFKAANSPFDNFVTAAAEAKAAAVLTDVDPILSAISLKAAMRDWEFAIEKLNFGDKGEKPRKPIELIQIYSEGALASIEIYRANKEQRFKDKAIEYAGFILGCQQQEHTGWDIPLNGFFYNNTEKKSLLHYDHRSHMQAPIAALSELCREFREHPDWISWYYGIFLFSEYMKRIMEFTMPYGMIPASIYRIDESEDPDFRAQVLNGIKLSEEYYLRLFPVWFAFRGNNSIMLSGAKALSCAAVTRRNNRLADLSQLNLMWMTGRNPFSQSLMYGEGYDFAPQYTAMSGNMTGSLPVGILTSRNRDIPYWPFNNCYNYKEVWVQPSARWLWLMNDLSGAACVYGYFIGKESEDIVFIDMETGKSAATVTGKNGERFNVKLAEGKYIARHMNMEKVICLLPGEKYNLDLERYYSIHISGENTVLQDVSIELEVKSNCKLNIEIRTKNILLEESSLELYPTDGEVRLVKLRGRILKENEPWLAVLIPDDNYGDCLELSGSSKNH